jgi:hypothetical protein
MTKIELQIKRDNLVHSYRQEMINQNNKSSLIRSYAAADLIQNQIRQIETQLQQIRS